MLAPLLRAREVSRSVAEIVRPPRRILPADAIDGVLRTEKGPWMRSQAAMFVEPLNELAGRRYQGIVYVGPSRTSKSMTMVLGGIAYAVMCSPADALLIHTAEHKARNYSRKELDRAIQHTTELKNRLSPRPRDDNVFDKHFRSGMVLNIAWPSSRHLASETFKYVFITDYDRPEHKDDIDGEGTLWDQAYVRVRTYRSRGKCVAESSPGGEYLEVDWKPTTLHEAPPATGILSVYNTGTRARLYWPCLECGEFFQAKPGLESFNPPAIEELEEEVKKKDLMLLAEQLAVVPCPKCGFVHRQEQKALLNSRHAWVHEGEEIRPDRTIVGERRRTDIVSYWQGGLSATYQTWTSLWLRYLQGLQQFVKTGSEASLKGTTNTDQAAPYLPLAIKKRRGTNELLKRAEEQRWPRGVVPVGVRFITAAIDVQSNRFVIDFYGWGEGLERWVIERIVISRSRRREGDGFAALEPAAYLEDWSILEAEVLERTFPLQQDDSKRIHAVFALCDSGGKAGATTRAYEFWRGLNAKGLGKRLMLLKGTGQLNAPRALATYPDVRDRKDRDSGARGDVPVWQLNVNQYKDAITGDMARETPGAGFVHLPHWLDAEYFAEMTVEKRNARGIWEKPHGAKNEAFDLHVYNRAICTIVKAETIDWNNPPEWAKPFEQRRVVDTVENQSQPSGRRMRSPGVRK